MNCEKCGKEHIGDYGSGRFCSSDCARSFSTATKRQEINKKVSIALRHDLENRQCKICGEDFTPQHKREVCCSKDCKHKNRTAHQKSLSKQERSLQSAKGSQGKYKRNPESLLDLSTRTISKIMRRLDIGCSRCGWNEATCDIHHIHGRKILNPDHHSNLTYICPNCHRLYHSNKIGPKDVLSLENQIGDRWKEFYYG